MNGHLGYGGDDLFVSRKQADGKWSKPENLGYPINTIENEGSLDGISRWQNRLVCQRPQ